LKFSYLLSFASNKASTEGIYDAQTWQSLAG